MSQIPENLKYTKDHEWIAVDAGALTVTVGITDHAQEMLTDIVFVELPEPGMEVARGEQVGVVESVKAVSNVYSPVSGRISDVNRALEGSPELLNGDPYGEGWLVDLRIDGGTLDDDLTALLDPDAYQASLTE